MHPALMRPLPYNWPLVFNLKEPQNLIEILNEILGDKIDLLALGSSGNSFVREKFSFEVMMEKYCEIYSIKSL